MEINQKLILYKSFIALANLKQRINILKKILFNPRMRFVYETLLDYSV